jgi:hypothetical protein
MGNTVGRLQSLFPLHQFDVIIGSLLGDARLECRSKGIRVFPITARLRVHHSEKQKDYVFWKYQILKNLVSEGPKKIMVWHDKKRDKRHYSWYFHTRSSEKLGLLYRYFYQDRAKVLSENILEVITSRILAVWFMDDGSNTKKSFTLNTHCFSEKDQMNIVKLLKERYHVLATIIKDRSKMKIRIGRQEYKKFIKIIQPFIIPSMIYKIVNPRNDLSCSAGRIEALHTLL